MKIENKNSKIPYFELGLREDESFRIRKILVNFGKNHTHEPAHRHNYQEIIWIQEGKGQQLIDDKKISIKESTFYLIGQGQVHQFISGQEIQGYLIRFTNDFLPANYLISSNEFNSSIIGRFVTDNQIKICKEEFDEFNQIMKMISQEAELSNGTFGRQNAIQQMLMFLLIKLERKARIMNMKNDYRVDGEERRFYSDFLSLLESFYHKQHHLDHYSSHLGLSKRRLSGIVRKMSGKTPKQIMIDRLVSEAKRLLIYTDISLKEITYMLGYNDPAYFCRVFRDHTGESPIGYKNSHREFSQKNKPNSNG